MPPPEKLGAQMTVNVRLHFFQFLGSLLRCGSGWSANQVLALALIGISAGCSGKPDPVVAAFVNDEFTTNRIVFYASGKYEHYGGSEDGSVARRPYVTGTFLGSPSNYVVSVKKWPWSDWPTQRVYRIFKHDDVEYLFDERAFGVIKKYEEAKDKKRELRHAWRRVAR